MKRCPKCGYIDPKRSTDISTHFHAHVTQIARESGMKRDYVYMKCLLLAVEMGACDGGADYPFSAIDNVLYPYPTSRTNNKQMMTLIEATHYFASTIQIDLSEKWEEQ